MSLSEIWFYQLSDNTARDNFILRLCDLSDKRQRPLTIYCPDKQLAQQLDEAIWSLAPERFLAHSLDNPDCPAAIQIVTVNIPAQGDIILNLTEEPLSLAQLAGYQRLIEIVLPDTVTQSRTRWKNYQQQGIKPELKMI
jgi:DNA polymerase-3 subunit chi